MIDNKPNKYSIKKRILSFKYALNGIYYAVKKEVNIQIHFFAAIAVVVLGTILNINSSEWILIVICITMVISAELFNSSIELLVDLVSPGKNKKAGLIKDISAGAVLVTAIGAALVGLYIFLPKLNSIF